MILCDREIQEALEQQRLVIRPTPTPELYSSTSLDIRLKDQLRLWTVPTIQPGMGVHPRFRPAHPGFVYRELEDQYTQLHQLTDDADQGGYNLLPGGFLLGYTLEEIYLPSRSRLCARVEGKSSLARLGLGVHVTAPTIHAGFGFNTRSPDRSGTPLVLEMWNVGPLPIELRKGMRICQLILEEVREVPTAGYAGQFNEQGPPPPRPRRGRSKRSG